MCCVPFSQYFPRPHPPVTVLSVSSPIWCPQRAHVQLQDGQRGESTASDPPPPQSERRRLCSDEPKRRFKMTWKTQPHSSHIGSPIQNTTVRTPAKFQSLHRMSQRWRERTRLRPMPTPGRGTPVGALIQCFVRYGRASENLCCKGPEST